MILRNRLHFPDSVRQIQPCLLACLLGLASLHADAANELVLQMETSLSMDTNPFRFYDGQLDQQQNVIPHQTDTVNSVDLRAGMIIPVASEQTRLILTGSLGNRHYKDYRQLDHQEAAGDAVFEWQRGKLFSGRLSAGRDQHLFQYINGSLTQKDLAHDKRAGADLSLHLTEDVSIISQLYRSDLNYDLDVNQLYNFSEKGKQISVRYTSPTASNIEIGARNASTDFPDRTAQQISDLGQQYQETEAFLNAEWFYSVKTATSAHLGYIRRRYENLAERDTGLFNMIWRATYHYSPEMRLDLQLYDRPINIVDPTILYVVTKGVRADVSWKWSEKTRFNVSGLWQNSDQQLIPRIAALNNLSSQKEKMQRLGFGASYQLERGFRLFMDSFIEKTDAETIRQTLRQTIVKIGLEYTFENLPGSASKLGLGRYQQTLSTTEASKE